MKQKISALLCTALAAGIAVTAASGLTAFAEEKVLRYAMAGEPETIDPGQNDYLMSSLVLANLYTGLMRVDETGEIAPGCAESYELSEDGLEYTFHLREGLKWSDGSDLTAADFEYAWKRALDPEFASPGSWYLFYVKNGEAYNEGEVGADEVGVEAVDDLTLKVTVEYPAPYFLDLTTVSVYYPVKKDVVEGTDGWTKSAETYVSNGPFKMSQINPQADYVLEKNPNYFDADSVNLDKMDIIFIDTPEAALTAYNAGEIDILESNLIGSEAQVQYADSDELITKTSIGCCYYDINCEKEYLSDPNVRKALSMALPRQIICENIVASHPDPAEGFVTPGISYGDSEEEYRDVVGPLVVENVEEAQKLLADAGYPGGEGFPTITLITQNDQEKKDVAQVMQAMWNQNLGINVEIVTYESKVYWDEQEMGNFDVCYDGWTGDYADPSTMLECFTIDRNSYQSRWVNDKAQQYDDLLMEARAETDNQRRAELFQEAETILFDEMPIIPVYYRNSQVLVKPYVKNVVKTGLAETILTTVDIVNE